MNEYELINKEIKIPPSHKCTSCALLLVDVHECVNRCSFYCYNHLPSNKKCEICDEMLEFNQKMNELIKKRYEIRCVHCDHQLLFGDLREHNQKSCQRNCPNECNIKMLENQIESHLKNDCINSIIECLGCFDKDKRGLINIHQQDCKFAQKFLEKIKQIEIDHSQKISELETRISFLQLQLNKKNKPPEIFKDDRSSCSVSPSFPSTSSSDSQLVIGVIFFFNFFNFYFYLIF